MASSRKLKIEYTPLKAVHHYNVMTLIATAFHEGKVIAMDRQKEGVWVDSRKDDQTNMYFPLYIRRMLVGFYKIFLETFSTKSRCAALVS